MCWPIVQGFFLDVPRVIDYAWRHAEYRLSAETDHKPGWHNPQTGQWEPADITLRPFYKKPAFWFFAITVMFASYGPTWDGLCAIAPQSVTNLLRQVIGLAIMAGSVGLVIFVLEWRVRFLIKDRFAEARRNESINPPHDLPFCRRATCRIVIYLGLVLLLVAGVTSGYFLFSDRPATQACAPNEWHPTAIVRFVICITAITLFGWLASRDRAYEWFRQRTGWQTTRLQFNVVAQFLLLAIVGLIQWFGLTTESTLAASDLPYRHVFLVWAPIIAFIIAFAPMWAWANFRNVTDETKQHFQRSLENRELFFQPTDPQLTGRAIFYALFFAPVNHLLHLLLFPALVTIAVPGNTLHWWVGVAFAVSLLLVVWGNMSPRWRELNIMIERWFLRGTPLFISLGVIVIAALRLFKVDYVSTLLDATPFGMLFGFVLMNYVLFWLAEYWMSRAIALELLGIMGDVQQETYLAYPMNFGRRQHPDVHVNVDERYLASHGTGRFVVLGNVLDTAVPCRAFQSYYLTETFALIDGDKDSKRVVDIVHRTGTYFLALNAALIFLAVLSSVYVFQGRERVIQPVVTESGETSPAAQLVDLSSLLEQQPGPVRPAIVVVGSGGGTRAALYTASVLKGLHGLNVDRDIVLVSGVSGGGVALAYFAANSAALTEQSAPTPPKLCPTSRGPTHSVDDEWDRFTANITKPFIEDVLNGATEWRIFANTALSALLAESFERHLFNERRLGSVRSPALILNTTIVSHPAVDSTVLTKTIDEAKSCEDAEQAFQLMSGGRLIFTNLRDIDAFLRHGPDRSLPDVRLPYQIVRDPVVSLAKAAALNANFPPVFPAAGVRVRGQGACAGTFYVTDGGAQENLGLISALYALDSALEKLKKRGGQARPIHVVIAEASALDYDYSQDRGISVILGGSRERLAGGLTRELRERVDAHLKSVNGPKAAVQYHFLGLPLAFRSRGGFGTHWLYAEEFPLRDPRPRTTARHTTFFWESGGERATIKRKALEELWLALHHPQTPFCRASGFSDPEAGKVQGWICGPPQGGAAERDLHMEAWNALVKKMREY